MKALASSQLVFEPASVPSLGLAFQKSLLYLFFTEVARSSSRQKMGEAARKHRVVRVQAERLQRGKSGLRHSGDLRSLEDHLVSRLSNLGFPCRTHSCWEAHLSVYSSSSLRILGPFFFWTPDKKKLPTLKPQSLGTSGKRG